jgi:hypothetical protein
MRSIRRVRGRVPTLTPGEPGGKKAAQHLAARETNPDAELTFTDHWNAADVRRALYAIHGKVCAYCGCHLPRNDRGDVDHYRPKNLREEPAHGGYWWLAYEFENYRLSCSTCNSSRKSDQFPLRPRARRVAFKDRARLDREARLLLDPASDPVEEWLCVKWHEVLCPIRPSDELPPNARVQVEATLALFKVNDDLRLIGERINAKYDVTKNIEDGRIDEARSRAIRFSPHSLVARQVLIDLGHALPSANEELQWLLDDLLEDLGRAFQILRFHSSDMARSELAEKQKEELLWSLAFLWHDLPADMRSDVELFLCGNKERRTPG